MPNISDEERLLKAVAILNAKALGIILGLLLGLAVFTATIWIVVKGPQLNEAGQYVMGPHLQLLSQFFLGYSVSFTGSIVGFLYGFALGTICGSLIGWIYNKIVSFRRK